MHCSACPLTSATLPLSLSLPPQLHQQHHPSLLHSSPQSQTHTFALARARPGLSLLWQTFIRPPLSSVQSFYPLFCCPSHLFALSSFLLFFPISSSQMRCCVQRRVCTFLIASSCPSIRWGKWACNETESTAVQTHTCRVCRYFLCVYACACACTFQHVAD